MPDINNDKPKMAYDITKCLIQTTDAFEGYPANLVLGGIRDYVVTVLVLEELDIKEFCSEITARHRELSLVVPEHLSE
jgi:hypothetical protein